MLFRFAGILNVYIPEPEKVLSMTVFNATGQRMKEILNIQNNEAIDVSAYPTGHYILRMVTLDGVKAMPFVKQ